MATTANETDQEQREDAAAEEEAPEGRRDDATEHRSEESTEDHREESTEHRPEEAVVEDSTMAPPDDGEEEEDQSPSTAARIVPRALLALVGIVCFVWLGSEMGSGATTGATPLVVTFGAIILGLLAGAAPFLVRRFSNHGES